MSDSSLLRPARPSLPRWLAIFAAVAVALIAAVLAALWASSGFESIGLDGADLVALALGATGTAVIATVLMGLVFYSGRYGHDEDAHSGGAPPGGPARASPPRHEQ
jgi:hypothetical protein